MYRSNYWQTGTLENRVDSRNFVEWFPEQLQHLGQIQDFVKGGA